MSAPEQNDTGTEEQLLAPTSLTSSDNLLSALISVDMNQPSQNLLSALLAMDRENLQVSMVDVPSNAGPMRRKTIRCIRFQSTRIKRIIQSDEKIGRVKDSVPAAIGKAMEHFAEIFLRECANEAKKTNSRHLKPSHLKAVVMKNINYSFLAKFFAEVVGPHPKDIKDPNAAEHADKSQPLSSEPTQ